jgi:hypothetical protein
MLPKFVEVILKLFRLSWSYCRSPWSNGMPWLTLELTMELWKLTQELWRPGLELWRLSFLNCEVMFELE